MQKTPGAEYQAPGDVAAIFLPTIARPGPGPGGASQGEGPWKERSHAMTRRDEIGGFLERQAEAEPRPDPENQAGTRYLRSYLFMRTVIGLIGVILPIAVVLVDYYLLNGTDRAKGSLSAYYYSGMRDWFVGSLCAIAVFLIIYKVFERHTENVLSTLAGFAALGIALFSTSRPPGGNIPLTPLQDRLGEWTTGLVHFISAAIFILLLGVISLFYGIREGERSQQRDGYRARLSPRFWKRFHWSCALAILVAFIFMVVTSIGGWIDRHLLYGETAAVLFFALSWLMKGLELPVLTGARAPQPSPPATLETAAR